MMTAVEPRSCPSCGTELVQRPGEKTSHFNTRQTCGGGCKRALLSRQRLGRRKPLEERLWARVERGGPNECWLWTGATTRNGYGVLGRGGKREGNVLAHRAALEITTGEEIPANREVDHLCRTRLCCNPAHLEVVTRQTNARRGTRTVRRLREKEWQQQVVELAQLYGWRHFHPLDMRGSDPGWPDLVLCRPPEILFVELKGETTRVTPAQEEWLWALTECGLESHIWRPGDFDEVHDRLRRRT